MILIFVLKTEYIIELIMGRLLESKNKRKCCITLSHCLTAQVGAHDEEHLYRENHNFLADAESDSENE
jgi:hypothetical protein